MRTPRARRLIDWRRRTSGPTISARRTMHGARTQREPIAARMILIVGSVAAFGPLTVDRYLPRSPEIGRS
jgi:hypothetical protein